MCHKYIRQKELEHRIKYHEIENWKTDIFPDTYPESYNWLTDLLQNLEETRNSAAHLNEVLQQQADKLIQTKENIDRIRFELAYIPVAACLEGKENEQFYLTVYSNDGASNDAEFDTKTFPKNAFSQNYSLDSLTVDKAYWFFFSLAELEICAPDYQHINPKDIITWSEQDSIVDWIMQFASNNNETDTPQITQHGDSIEYIFWKLQLPKTQLTEESKPTIVENTTAIEESKPTIVDKTTAIDNILRLIQKNGRTRENGITTTAEILAQSYCKPRNVYKSLRLLEKENKIVKVGHGKYAPATIKRTFRWT